LLKLLHLVIVLGLLDKSVDVVKISFLRYIETSVFLANTVSASKSWWISAR
jgi:hypothetical protein